jgi:hypothetical protein
MADTHRGDHLCYTQVLRLVHGVELTWTLGKGGQAYHHESRRPIRAGQRVTQTPLNDRERRRPRDIRGMWVSR